MKLVLLCFACLIGTVFAGCTNQSRESYGILPFDNKITGIGNYSLECKSLHYIQITAGLPKPSEYQINDSKGHEKEVLYVKNESASFYSDSYLFSCSTI